MGIPAYFRWISERYPKMMADCIEFVDYDESTGTERRIDASKPNPNGQEFDNLYLDMNGIIHPCTHPEDGPAPTTEEEMFTAVCNYIDRVFGIVRPRRVLYMAIDGVAPRAKINQQRSRRFRSVREAAQKAEEQAKLREEWREMGLKVKEEDPDAPPPFDSNVITPGTPFMSRLALALREYVADRIANEPAWRNLRVIFSDASVPGEGEHKIAEFIRVERAQKGYDASVKHVMYGLDADLIMLALTTHEAHFSILRELVFPKRGGPHNGKGPGGSAADPRGQHNRSRHEPSEPVDSGVPPQVQAMLDADGLKTRAEIGKGKPFHFLHVHTLREYLDIEYRHDILREMQGVPDTEVQYNLERVIDDFVFLCFFVGNDFLPHLPTLDIREGAVDFIIELYKAELPRVGYLTSDGGNIDFARVRQMLAPIGVKEDEIFKDRMEREAEQKRRRELQKEADKAAAKRRKMSAAETAASASGNPPANVPFSGQKFDSRGRRIGTTLAPAGEELVPLGRNSNAAVAEELRRSLGRRGKVRSPGGVTSPRMKRKVPDSDDVKPKPSSAAGGEGSVKKQKSLSPTKAAGVPMEASPKKKAEPVEKSKAEFKEEIYQRMRAKNEIKNPHDNVKLGEEGWKDRYYSKKFGWEAGPGPEKDQLLRHYLEGLHWVMKYYYVGCVSWGWYYPYHYAPFASDLVASTILADDIQLDYGEPFRPFTQLQAVMPASSGKLVLPTCYSDLMTKSDSPILDYYPEEFELDLNGKRFEWQGVALLPFIDEARLNAALDGLVSKLTEEELARNSFGAAHVAVHRGEPLGALIASTAADSSTVIPADVAAGQFFGTVTGPIDKDDGSKPAVFGEFRLPDFIPHSSALLPTAVAPAPVLDNASRSGMMFFGWKQSRFGVLGQAAREISDRRYGRSSHRGGRGGRGGRGRGGRGGRGRDGGHRGGRDGHRGWRDGHRGGGRGGYRDGGRGGGPHPAASEMFGGLGAYGAPRGAYQGGGRGGYQGSGRGGHQGGNRGEYGAPAYGGTGAYGAPPAQQYRPYGGGGRGGYGYHQRQQPYGGHQQQPYGGHHQQGGHWQQEQAPQQQQQHWQQQQQPQLQHYPPNGAYNAPYVPGSYNPHAQPFHPQQGGQHPQQGQYPQGGGGGRGGGLAGPTAANLRSFPRGRGRGGGQR